MEGYRAKDEGELELCNWRSTPVVQRITSRVLLTRSGTKYVLQGIIDEESLLALGLFKILPKSGIIVRRPSEHFV